VGTFKLAMVQDFSFLIAEDDELVGKLMRRALAKHGDVVLVSTAAGARRALRERGSFTGVVVDISLPDGSGFDVLAVARAGNPSVAALIVSGSVDERRLAEAHRLSAAYLLKPVDIAELDRFAARSTNHERQEKLNAIIARWAVDHELTPAETGILELAAEGHSRPEIASLRGVASGTVKKQVQIMLTKTGDSSLDAAVHRLLRSVVGVM
jgi:two-component system response regulator QseB